MQSDLAGKEKKERAEEGQKGNEDLAQIHVTASPVLAVHIQHTKGLDTKLRRRFLKLYTQWERGSKKTAGNVSTCRLCSLEVECKGKSKHETAHMYIPDLPGRAWLVPACSSSNASKTKTFTLPVGTLLMEIPLHPKFAVHINLLEFELLASQHQQQKRERASTL
jgi:hypothetical protein